MSTSLEPGPVTHSISEGERRRGAGRLREGGERECVHPYLVKTLLNSVSGILAVLH